MAEVREEAIKRAAHLIDDSRTQAGIAAKALDRLRALVVDGQLTDDGTGTLDVDAFDTFAEGIAAILRNVMRDTGEAWRMVLDA